MRYAWIAMATVAAMADSVSYRDTTEQWRHEYEEKLKKPDGWLSVAGLSWVHEGENKVGSEAENEVVLPARFPAHAGTLVLTGDTAVLRTKGGEQKLVAEKDPVALGDVTVALLARDHRYAIRLRDPEAETRKHFTGTKWFPANEAYRVEAKWVPYDPPHHIPIASILGYTEQQDTPGYAEFRLNGETYRLEPIVEDPTYLFFIFKDKTSVHETYGAGRFLKADNPKDGKVILDFNRAYNPPCAYTAFATCPLPPKQNAMATRIEAGELRYGNH